MLYFSRFILIVTFFFQVIFQLGMSYPLFAQQESVLQEAQEEQANAPEEDPAKRRLEALGSLLEKIIEQKQHVMELQEKLKQAQTEQEEADILSQLGEAQAQLSERNDSFMQLITGISVRVFDQAPPQKESSAMEELKTIFEPLLGRLKEVTTRTRRIEQLRTEIAASKDLEQRIVAGLEQTRELQSQTENVALLSAFGVAIDKIQQRLEDLKQDRVIKEEQLAKLQADRGLWASVQQFFGDLLGYHLLNLAIMVLATSGVYIGFRVLYGRILKLPAIRRGFEEVYWFRIVDVLIRGLILTVAAIVGMFVLYFLNDWILIALFALLAIGFLWSMKDSIPQQMQSAQLLLNVGSVREKERVMFRGLPWEVKPISYYTHLVNPALEGGRVRLKLSELDGLSSRPFSRNDQWFPTRKLDWVILADGTYGQVLLQTPEHVVLRIFGVSEKTYTTQAFLGNSPLNISKGYALFLIFGVDYAHQKDVTQTIPAILETEIHSGFQEAGQAEHMESLFVEFNDASSSSLDFAIFAQFNAKTADRYYKMRRLLLRLLVESCTRHDWTIPFTQLTVHAAGGSAPPEAAQTLEADTSPSTS